MKESGLPQLAALLNLLDAQNVALGHRVAAQAKQIEALTQRIERLEKAAK